MRPKPFRKRRVPWHAPFPIFKRRQRLARLKRKGLLPRISKAAARRLCAAAIEGRQP